MSDINTTPLVDVMLVLLIIFLITVPVVMQTVPHEAAARFVTRRPTTKPENVLAVGARRRPAGPCEVYWNLTQVNYEELLDRAVKKLEDEIERRRRRREHHRGEYARSAYPRRRQHAVPCIGGAIFTMQTRRLRPRRLHFRAACRHRPSTRQ